MARFFLTMVLAAADWLSSSADPKHTRSQPAETELSPPTVGNLKLLWKFPFEERVTAPVVLGPIFTHRGIKELVFVAGAGDNLYAVDADLARLFWKRHFDVPPTDCGTGLTAAPVLAPYNGPMPEGDDAGTPRRSLFVLTSDGQLRTVRPSDAKDLALPESFLPAGSLASDLTLTSSVITSYVSGGCGNPQQGTWGHRVNGGGVKLAVTPGPNEPKRAGWKTYTLAVSEDKLSGVSTPRMSQGLSWFVPDLVNPQPPIAANGVVFTTSGTALAAIEIATGKRLFLSEPNGSGAAQDSLAVANGHVYFVANNTLYCYGFPIEIE